MTGCDTPSYVVGVQYSNPPWAPAYYPGVRYYYLPDIEAYYDLSNQQFVYFDNGQWLFSTALPSIYGSYDLFNGFVIALNFRVFEPWKYHHNYLSHYPRYYYNNFYRDRGISTMRGFNENDRNHFFRKQDDHNRRDDGRDNKPERKPEISRPPRNFGNDGKNIGEPVKVTPPMREYKPGLKRPERHK